MQTPHATNIAVLSLAVIALFAGCAGDGDGSNDGREPSGSATAGKGGDRDLPPVPGGDAPSESPTAVPPSDVLTNDAGVQPGSVCATVRAEAELAPVHLAFAFDVSGSMGKGDEPWHDRSLKWDPVTAATRAFFADDASSGLLASLTFFPEDGDEDERCELGAYEEPDVEMTELPSESFGEAIDEIEPESEDDWRGGTPTLFAVQGVTESIRAYREDHPGHFALVLVTDGYPQGCDDDADSVDAVVDEVRSALDDDEIETYVIGVANPPIDDAPDTVSDLQAIAEAGGTDEAFLIDTGDPEATSTAFRDAVSAIRGRAITCSLPIPTPPDGRELDRRKVAVTYGHAGSAPEVLRYDPDCGGDDTWHYDVPAAPTAIELCEQTCQVVQSDPAAELGVDFACEVLLTVD